VEYFAVTTVHGPKWDATKSIRAQAGWEAHATFLDALVEDGFIVLGGPIDDGEHALLVTDATDEVEVRRRLDADPWASMDLLHVGTVSRWAIWLDGRNRPDNG